MTVSGGVVSQYVLGLFLNDIARELGWARGRVSFVFSLYFLGQAISVPIAGWLVDRFGARKPAMASVCLYAAALAMLALCRGPTAFTVMSSAAGLLAGGTMVIPYVVTIAAKFDRQRGLALGIGASGVALGGILLPPLVQALITTRGWREAMIGLAVMIPTVALPCAWLALSRRSESVEPLAMSARSTGRSSFYSRDFWLLGSAVFLVSGGASGAIIHAAALLGDGGVSPGGAAKIVSLIAAAAVTGRVLGGFLMDRLHAPYVAAAFFVIAGAAMALLAVHLGAAWATIGLLGIGLAVGAEADAIAFLSARSMTHMGLGRANGLLMLMLTLGSSAGIAAFGRLYDAYGSYSMALTLAAPLQFVAAMAISRVAVAKPTICRRLPSSTALLANIPKSCSH